MMPPKIDTKGQRSDYQYDDAGRLEQIDYYPDVASTTPSKTVMFSLTSTDDPLMWISDLRFFDELSGIMSVTGSLGNVSAYHTQDGGMTWNKLFKSRTSTLPETDTVYKYPNFEPLPSHAPLWTKQYDFYKITRILQLLENENEYRIEQYVYSNDMKWRKISTIPKSYNKADRLIKLSSEMCFKS